MGGRAQTGDEHRTQRINVRFSSFEEPERMVTRQFDISPGDFLTHGAAEGEKAQLGRTRLPAGHYLYVYRRERAGTWWLRYELMQQGGRFRKVAWGASSQASAEQREQYQPSTEGAYERRAYGDDTVDFGDLMLDVSYEHVVIHSRIQLPFHRVEAYRTDEALLKSRGVRIPAGSEPSSTVDYLAVHVPDLLSVAEKIHATYVERLEALQAMLTDPVRAKKRTLATMVKAVTDSDPGLADHLRDEGPEAALENIDEEVRENEEAVRYAAHFLKGCLTLSGFEAMLYDYSGEPFYVREVQEAYAGLLDGLLGHPKGIDILRDIAENEESWANRLLFSPDDIPHKGDAIEEANVLEDIAMHILLGRAFQSVEDDASAVSGVVIEEFEAFVSVHESRFGPQTGVTLAKIAGSTRDGVALVFDDTPEALEGWVAERKNWQARVNSLEAPLQKLLLAAALVNLVIAFNNLRSTWQDEDADGWDVAQASLGQVGAVAGTVSASKFLIENTGAGNRMLATRGGAQVMRWAGLVGTITGYSSSLIQTWQTAEDDEMGLAAGHACMAASAVFMGWSAAAAGGTVAFGFGAAAAGPLLLIGVGLLAGGALLIQIFTTDPFEEWLEHSCPWGNEALFQDADLSDPRAIREDELDDRIQELAEILYAYEADLTLSHVPSPHRGTFVGVRIRPNMILDESTVSIEELRLYRNSGQRGQALFVPEPVPGRSEFPWESASYEAENVLVLEGNTNHRLAWDVHTQSSNSGREQEFELYFVYPSSVSSAEAKVTLDVQPGAETAIEKMVEAEKGRQILHRIRPLL